MSGEWSRGSPQDATYISRKQGGSFPIKGPTPPMFSMVMMSLRICTPHPVCVGHLWVGDHGFEPTRWTEESKYQRLRKQRLPRNKTLCYRQILVLQLAIWPALLKVGHTR